jgi:hypothetical protein
VKWTCGQREYRGEHEGPALGVVGLRRAGARAALRPPLRAPPQVKGVSHGPSEIISAQVQRGVKCADVLCEAAKVRMLIVYAFHLPQTTGE